MIKAMLIKFTGNYAVGFSWTPRKDYKKGQKEVISTMEDFRTAMRLGCEVLSEWNIDVAAFEKLFKGKGKAETPELEPQEGTPATPQVEVEAPAETPKTEEVKVEDEVKTETPADTVEAPAETNEETQK